MSDLLQRIDRLYELDAEPLMFAVGASALLIECRTQIESLSSENTRLREALEFIRGTSTSVPLGEWEQVFFRQQVLSCIHRAEMVLEPPSHKGED